MVQNNSRSFPHIFDLKRILELIRTFIFLRHKKKRRSVAHKNHGELVGWKKISSSWHRAEGWKKIVLITEGKVLSIFSKNAFFAIVTFPEPPIFVIFSKSAFWNVALLYILITMICFQNLSSPFTVRLALERDLISVKTFFPFYEFAYRSIKNESVKYD